MNVQPKPNLAAASSLALSIVLTLLAVAAAAIYFTAPRAGDGAFAGAIVFGYAFQFLRGAGFVVGPLAILLGIVGWRAARGGRGGPRGAVISVTGIVLAAMVMAGTASARAWFVSQVRAAKVKAQPALDAYQHNWDSGQRVRRIVLAAEAFAAAHGGRFPDGLPELSAWTAATKAPLDAGRLDDFVYVGAGLTAIDPTKQTRPPQPTDHSMTLVVLKERMPRGVWHVGSVRRGPMISANTELWEGHLVDYLRHQDEARAGLGLGPVSETLLAAMTGRRSHVAGAQ
jgi:hypothetical protein